MDKKLTLEDAQKARDSFLEHLGKTLDPDQLAKTLGAADKLFDLAMKPGMLNAFAMVNAELTVLYLQDETVLVVRDEVALVPSIILANGVVK